jgi:hypothetical protein
LIYLCFLGPSEAIWSEEVYYVQRGTLDLLFHRNWVEWVRRGWIHILKSQSQYSECECVWK